MPGNERLYGKRSNRVIYKGRYMEPGEGEPRILWAKF